MPTEIKSHTLPYKVMHSMHCPKCSHRYQVQECFIRVWDYEQRLKGIQDIIAQSQHHSAEKVLDAISFLTGPEAYMNSMTIGKMKFVESDDGR